MNMQDLYNKDTLNALLEAAEKAAYEVAEYFDEANPINGVYCGCSVNEDFKDFVEAVNQLDDLTEAQIKAISASYSMYEDRGDAILITGGFCDTEYGAPVGENRSLLISQIVTPIDSTLAAELTETLLDSMQFAAEEIRYDAVEQECAGMSKTDRLEAAMAFFQTAQFASPEEAPGTEFENSEVCLEERLDIDQKMFNILSERIPEHIGSYRDCIENGEVYVALTAWGSDDGKWRAAASLNLFTVDGIDRYSFPLGYGEEKVLHALMEEHCLKTTGLSVQAYLSEKLQDYEAVLLENPTDKKKTAEMSLDF